jgi:hypothetical protein
MGLISPPRNIQIKYNHLSDFLVSQAYAPCNQDITYIYCQTSRQPFFYGYFYQDALIQSACAISLDY